MRSTDLILIQCCCFFIFILSACWILLMICAVGDMTETYVGCTCARKSEVLLR